MSANKGPATAYGNIKRFLTIRLVLTGLCRSVAASLIKFKYPKNVAGPTLARCVLWTGEELLQYLLAQIG